MSALLHSRNQALFISTTRNIRLDLMKGIDGTCALGWVVEGCVRECVISAQSRCDLCVISVLYRYGPWVMASCICGQTMSLGMTPVP
jgi:hypothetical protein